MFHPQVTKLTIADSFLIQPSVHREYRGEILSLYNKHYNQKFVEDKLSWSPQLTLRGIHGDFCTTKLLSCLYGSVQLVIVDARHKSPTFGEHESIILTDCIRNQVLIPPGVFNGHLCLTESCLFWYKLSVGYKGEDEQLTIYWFDSYLGIDWATKNPIVSNRDKNADCWGSFDWTQYKVENED